MIRLKLKCLPYVADYLKKKFGEEVQIGNKDLDIKNLKTFMRLHDTAEGKKSVEGYGAEFTVCFPDMFIFPRGRIGFSSEALVEFNNYVRDTLATGMNRHMDSLIGQVNFLEKDVIYSYLQSQGVHIDNLVAGTWEKIRLRHKQGENGGRVRKKTANRNVLQNAEMSYPCQNLR